MRDHKRAELRSQWKAALKTDLDERDGIPVVVNARVPLADWNLLRSPPHSRIETELLYAVRVAAGDYDHPLVKTCLERAVDVFKAGEKDARWHTIWAHSRRVSHGSFASAGVLAHAWANDSEPDMALVIEAGRELLEGSVQERPAWTEMAQCEYLHGIQLCLIAAEPTLAVEGLQVKRSWVQVQGYYGWQIQLVDLMSDSSTENSLIAEKLDSFFDLVRNPSLRDSGSQKLQNILDIGLLRLRLALIRWIYIERKPIAGNWRHIIGQIGY